MSLRPTTLTFSGSSPFLPADLPLEVWEVRTDSNCTFEIEPTGKVIRKDRLSGTRWNSPDLIGSFTVMTLPKNSLTEFIYEVFVVNGRVTHMGALTGGCLRPLHTLRWRWVLDCLDVDEEARELARTYVGCIQLIQQAELNTGFRSGDLKVDAMIGMALCRQALLGDLSAREALDLLDDHQLRATSHWHRAQ